MLLRILAKNDSEALVSAERLSVCYSRFAYERSGREHIDFCVTRTVWI